MDEAIEFLRRYVDAEYRARRANYGEPDDQKFRELVRAWDKLYGGAALGSGLSRPPEPPALYATPDYVAAAERQQPRTIYAVAHYRSTEDVYRAWLGDTEQRRRGEGMRQNLYLARDQGALRVMAVHSPCNSCLGSGVEDGERCTTCEGAGWLFNRGVEWPELGPALDVRRFAPPSDARYQGAYNAIPQP